tara:strand:- start:144 stop:566 length:423 start_codon:yes stop_codon:yes gene_type:complete
MEEKIMKAVLINPKLRKIKEIEYSGDYQDIQKLTECSTITAIYPFDNQDTIYLDDEGLLKESNYCFTFKYDNGYVQPLMGNALVIGAKKGKNISYKTPITEIKNRIVFKGHQEIIMASDGIKLNPLPTIINDEDLAFYKV